MELEKELALVQETHSHIDNGVERTREWDGDVVLSHLKLEEVVKGR